MIAMCLQRGFAAPRQTLQRLGLALTGPLALVLLSACAVPGPADSSLLGRLTPYRIEIVQGNVVTRELAALVRPGMSREQVRELLGSPMLTDPFHAERWDYVFFIRRQGAQVQRRSVVAHFKAEVLERLEVPEALPSEEEFVAAIDPQRRRPVARALELTPQQREALPAPKRPPTTPSTPAQPEGPRRPYPALEPT